MPIKKTEYRKYLLFTIVALACAASLWSASYSREAELLFRIQLYGLPEGLTVVDWPSKTLEVRVRGPKSMIEKLDDIDPVYPVNLADAKEGVQPIDVRIENLPLPEGITVVGLSTGDRLIRLERTVQKTVPVSLSTTGKAAFGYRIADTVASPRSVQVKGPASKLSDLDSARAHAIDVNGASATFTKDFVLNLPEGVFVVPKNLDLSATIVIEEERAEKILENIRVEGSKTLFDYIIQPESIHLTVSSTIRCLSTPLSQEDVSVYLDLEGLAPGIYVKPAVIHLPEQIKLIKADPQVFTVQILKSQNAIAGE